MKFGIGTFSCDRHRDDDRPHAALYQEMLAVAQVAEENNFDSAWVTEHHFTPGGYMPSVTSGLAALATATEKIEIGTNIALGPQYQQPVRLAEDLAVIDHISEGRLKFGVGNGYRVQEFETFDIPLDQRALRLENLIEILRKAWTDDELTHEGHPILGNGFSFDGVPITPKPYQEGGPPIIVGGFAPPAIRRAGRMGDGFSMGSLVGVDQAKEAVDLYWQSIDDVGKNPDNQELVIWNFAFLHDKKDPMNVIEAGWEQTLDQYGRWYHNAGMIENPDDLHDGFNEAAMFYDSSEEMIEKIEEYREIFGEDTHFIYQASLPGLDVEDLKYSVELFGQEVIPAFT
ncbi:LLM class flavin-dependent oxidoreductase [Halocatena pleomorpha]|uniref:LLM class flavin-dependent oxidoreductase n=1 Tax=Halocatena pleomorpha TaxID=1785090 RepID=A0A3P3R7H3_9EURY|nr:LLM class flavin-dependent oxidoreductase [Halocatena pleomorpha]RRJ29387.1 LLM class flavin-dependent oxidoreductase [Halocatena pleomorpha]